jgi:hypothetical protein
MFPLAMQGAEQRPLLPTFPPPHPIPSHPHDLQTILLRQIYPDDGGTKLFRNVGDYLPVDPRRLESNNLLPSLVIAVESVNDTLT